MAKFDRVSAKAANRLDRQASLTGGDHQGFGHVKAAGNEVAALIFTEKLGRIGAVDLNAEAGFFGKLEGGKRKAAIAERSVQALIRLRFARMKSPVASLLRPDQLSVRRHPDD